MQKTFGQVAYEASVKPFDGSDVDLGDWSDMDEGVKELWAAVAGAVLDEAATQLRASAEEAAEFIKTLKSQ